MPRPRKCRRVCRMPGSRSFGPLDARGDGHRVVAMTVDEFETIRLIDLEGFSQEQCAESMGVARTTVQAIYASARVKLAGCLVNGLELSIGGGDYVFCGEDARGSGRCHCHKRRCHSGDGEHESTESEEE
jgi:predicted DNA-binding protein (UPF0251 family)